jgi:UDP-glucose 4-epimerase
MTKALVTGGAGFIGSTIGSAFFDAGIESVILDDLSTGRPEFANGRRLYVGDVADGDMLDRIFTEHPDITHVVHCAAKIVVPESVQCPIEYYRNNVSKLIELVAHLQRLGCTRFIFSSSASIYRPDDDLTVSEQSQIDPQSPYAATKAMAERILGDASVSGDLRVLSLRYFNPVGADPELRSGLQLALPSHALGQLMRAHQDRTPFTITGTDWATRDGTGIRDYIHVWDLALAHVAALQRFDVAVPRGGHEVINIGTGRGTTVRELVSAFERAVGESLPILEASPRPGDVIGCYTRSQKANRLLRWTATHSIEQAVKDSLAWAQRRPAVLPGFS